MEHRCAGRTAVNLEVVIESGAGSFRGLVLNVSCESMFVALRSSRADLRSVVEVVVAPPGTPRPEALRLRALVAHQDAHGVGLMFAKHDDTVSRFLAALRESATLERRQREQALSSLACLPRGSFSSRSNASIYQGDNR